MRVRVSPPAPSNAPTRTSPAI